MPSLLEEIRTAYQKIRSQAPWKHEKSDYWHHRILPFATLAPWLDDIEFVHLYEKIRSHTLVDIYRCYELWSLAKQCANVEGDLLEVGVWRGGTGCILASAIRYQRGKKVYLADTFSGVVKAGVDDTRYVGGEHADTSATIVQQLVDELSLENVQILQGIFPEDTQDRITGKIALLHCDVDVYRSSKDIVEWCLPRLSVGAIIIFDDYGFFGCEGVTRYCEELRQRPEFKFIHNLNGHAIFIKITVTD